MALDLRSALEQFRRGALEQNKASEVTSGTHNSEAAKADLFALDDDDDLFEPDMDLFGASLPVSNNIPARTTQSDLSQSAQLPPLSSSVQLIAYPPNKSSTTSAPSTSNCHVSAQTKSVKTAYISKPSVPHSSSIQKLKSFKFVKTSSLLGKRTNAEQDSVDCHSNVSKDEIGPPLSKKSAPLFEDYLFDDITPDDIMGMDELLDIDEGSGDSHVTTQSQTELFSTPVNHQLSKDPTTATPQSTHSPRITSTPSTSLLQNLCFKAPTSGIKEYSTTHKLTTCISRISSETSTPRSQKSVTSTPTKGLSSASQSSTPSSHTPSSVPSVFRTPLSRQPMAMVCTPMGDECAPVIMRATTSNRRKFPGPAGLLPSLAPGQCMDNICIQPPSTPRPASTPRVQGLTVSRECSSDEECFSSGPWIMMLDDLDMTDSHSSALLQYSIANALKQAHSKMLSRGKVPHLRVLLKSIAPAGKNASAVLKDPSGEILCTIHSKVFEDHQKELQPGAAIILRQVSLFSPAPRKYYLNITPDNIIRVYPPEPSDSSPQGFLDLASIERVYNSENISPPPPSKRSSTSKASLTVPTQSVQTFTDHPPVRHAPRTIHTDQDSLTIITRKTSNTSSHLRQTAPGRDSQVPGNGGSVLGARLIDVDGKKESLGEDSVTGTDKIRRWGSFFDQFCDVDIDDIIGHMDDNEAFNF